MKTRLRFIAWASLAMASVPFASGVATAGVRVCTFPGSPSTSLDRAVAREAFKTAGIAASLAAGGFEGSDDDGVSVKELNEALRHSCDVIAGFPRSTVADGSGSKLLFSRGYLRSGYVSVTKKNPSAAQAAANVVAATYASPAQLIAVQQRDVALDIENTPELTVEAVVKGHARSAIVWYPAVVAYTAKHPEQQLDVASTPSPYADWHLVFAFGANGASIRQRIDAALDRMAADGRLAELTRKWALPASTQAGQPSQSSFAYRDGPAYGGVSALRAQLASAEARQQGGFIKVDASSPAGAPPFDSAQVAHGKSLYSGACAKCHGAELQGVNAPALKGPAFAPAANAHLTIGGVFGYMATNMPADRPGKMKPQDYADIMSFLLYSNGYQASSAKLTADSARASTTPLNAGTSH